MITRTALAGLLLSIALSACAGATSPSTPNPTPSPAPSGDQSAPGGGVVGGNPGAGGGTGPIGGPIGGGPVDPGQPSLVFPKPGQHNVHAVSIDKLSARVEGHHVVLNARWWSGVAPCSVLDSVAAKQDGQTITVSVREGSSGEQVACIDIAMLKATVIDLGDLAPGDYTIAADLGPAAAITVTVS
ncbi:MAG: hypothetical protein M3067_13130 [Chloroflexota bacterium]|nr:hypothetical protein [Chloroflexota bacterium]